MPFLHIRDLLVALSTATFVHRKHPKTLHLGREMTRNFFKHLQKFDLGAYVSCQKWAFVVAVLLHLNMLGCQHRDNRQPLVNSASDNANGVKPIRMDPESVYQQTDGQYT